MQYSASAVTSKSATGSASDKTRCCKAAVLRWFEIIGEASRRLTNDFRNQHPDVPWREITDMRNRVTHGYFDIDLEVVWNTITRDLPALEEAIVSWLRPSERTPPSD